MSFRRYNNKKGDPKFPKMVDFFSNIVSIGTTKTWNKTNEFSPIKFDFDIFYLCLIIGVKYNLRENDSNYTNEVFYNQENFPKEYNSEEILIMPSILYQISISDNYDLGNRESARELINDYVKKSKLSKNVIQAMNEYSLGGYLKLLETFNYTTPDEDISKFFNKYNKLLFS
tara:strand:- start:47 stop:562 length:516 start_codon:yes stop_codon:yes gene_type:complete